MKVTYTRKEDYLLPDLYLEKGENYGILRLHFIAQNKQALYETLLMTNKLTHHLLLESKSCENYYKELWKIILKMMKDDLKKQRIKSIGMDKINE